MVTRKCAFYSDEKGNIDAEAWLNHVALQRPRSRLRLIQNAIALSQLTSAHKKTPLGVSCLQQGFGMADLLLDLMMDEDTICAALLYNAVCFAELDLITVEEQLNSNVTKLLKGALRMSNINHGLVFNNFKQNQLEKLRKMLLSMADDMRVVLVKLVERVAWMRAVNQQATRTRATRIYARETLTIYASLANRLGTHDLRYELEDLSMEQLAPRLYKNMANALKERLIDRENYIKELVQAIEVTLPRINIEDFRITSRAKNLYGAYQKMCKKKVPLHEVYDLNAIRIIVSTVEECYQVLGVIQTLWTPVTGEFDDYIQSPKENNYRSIHLAVYGNNGKIIEMQVRTFEMDQESEHGLAAHWEYKENTSHKPDYHMKIAWLRQVLTWQKELVRKRIHLMPELNATLDDRVYLLTQSDDIVDLPKGATALDFAYHINAEMGHYCDRVFVNGTPQALTYVLCTGEKVEVLTDLQLKVSWDWLNPDLGYLNTAQAKAKVLHWFQQKDYYQHIVTGQLLLEKACRQLNIKFVDQEKLAHDLSFQSKQELLAALGSGELQLIQALHALHPYSKQKPPYLALSQPTSVLTMRENVSVYGANTKSEIEIYITTAASTDTVNQIIQLLRKLHINLSRMSTEYQATNQKIYISLGIKVDNAKVLDHLEMNLRLIKGIFVVDIRS